MQEKQIHNFMKQTSFVTSKKMGQNFLSSLSIKKRIVESADLQKGDFVLEIGPGLGAITEIILHHPVKLVAVELDKRLYSYLSEKFAGNTNFSIINNDVLEVDLDALIKENGDGKKAIVVANLPYSISSKIILKILKTIMVDRCVIMVQKEMANRIVAKPNSKDYNAFTALLSLYLDIKYLFTVGPKNFVPAPKVDSGVIEISRKDNGLYEVEKIPEYEEFLRICFVSKRKTLLNNLGTKYSKEIILQTLERLQIDSRIRAEALDAATLIKIYDVLNDHETSSLCQN